MKRIPDMDRQLDNWARWLREGGGVGTGYARSSIYCREYVDGNLANRSSAIPIDALDAQRMNEAVDALQLSKSHLHMVVVHHYRESKEIKQVAKLMLKSPATINTYLAQADHELQLWFRNRSRALRRLPVHTTAPHDFENS